MANKNYLECKKCVMNNDVDPNLTLDVNGLCNHCQRYRQILGARISAGAKGKESLDNLLIKIKNSGKGKNYDCLIGVSGGVDSTYVAYLVKDLGLRPLAVHFDNGWDSELSVKNIEQILSKLNIDLYTYVVDWEEFRELQKAFLRASTPDGEIPTDHAIYATLWKVAAQHKIKYIISGMNFATESMSVPEWSYGHSDWRYIKNINKIFGKSNIKSYPHYSLAYLFYITFVLRIKRIAILNYVDYNKNSAIEIIQSKLGWIPYGGKHHESIYTRFWQGYVLPKKFKIDKRYAHFSDLINSGQFDKSSALEQLMLPPYSEDLQNSDCEYVMKKLGYTKSEFDEIMSMPVKSFRNYKNNHSKVELLKKFVDYLRSIGLYPK